MLDDRPFNDSRYRANPIVSLLYASHLHCDDIHEGLSRNLGSEAQHKPHYLRELSDASINSEVHILVFPKTERRVDRSLRIVHVGRGVREPEIEDDRPVFLHSLNNAQRDLSAGQLALCFGKRTELVHTTSNVRGDLLNVTVCLVDVEQDAARNVLRRELLVRVLRNYLRPPSHRLDALFLSAGGCCGLHRTNETFQLVIGIDKPSQRICDKFGDQLLVVGRVYDKVVNVDPEVTLGSNKQVSRILYPVDDVGVSGEEHLVTIEVSVELLNDGRVDPDARAEMCPYDAPVCRRLIVHGLLEYARDIVVPKELKHDHGSVLEISSHELLVYSVTQHVLDDSSQLRCWVAPHVDQQVNRYAHLLEPDARVADYLFHTGGAKLPTRAVDGSLLLALAGRLRPPVRDDAVHVPSRATLISDILSCRYEQAGVCAIRLKVLRRVLRDLFNPLLLFGRGCLIEADRRHEPTTVHRTTVRSDHHYAARALCGLVPTRSIGRSRSNCAHRLRCRYRDLRDERRVITASSLGFGGIIWIKQL